jgi:hypothetical protein
MKAIRLSSFALVLFFAVGGTAISAPPQDGFRFFMSPRSYVPTSEILKNLNEKCPGSTIVLDPKKSDYMLEAGGWSGNYRFVVFRKGGEAVFSTQTVMLSNAVKDVCRFVKNDRAAAH